VDLLRNLRAQAVDGEAEAFVMGGPDVVVAEVGALVEEHDAAGEAVAPEVERQAAVKSTVLNSLTAPESLKRE